VKIAVAQINTTVGDFAGNEAKMVEAYRRGVEAGARLVILPELSTTGYPPRDLLMRPAFVRRNLECLDRVAARTGGAGLVAGFVGTRNIRPGREVTNAVALCQEGRILAVRTKSLLPTYDVFDEDRYFEPAKENTPVEFDGVRLGLTVCEDLWNDEGFWPEPRYPRNPAAELVAAGASMILNLSASPWHLGKNRTRYDMLSCLAARTRVPVVYCNLVGGNDELVFDGGSLVVDRAGSLVARAALFAEDLLVVESEAAGKLEYEEGADEERVYQALVLGLGDYLGKCGFTSAVLGLSGGIDSAVTACLAAAALGPDHVRGVSLPSAFSSQGSLDDARALASHLGIRHDVIPIQPAFESVRHQLREVFSGRKEDVTEENIQARLRGVILMALSNKTGALLLTTGNKSEMAVGYCTLYGDMCGGLAVISDVPKTMVYRLARWINREREVIPQASIDKPPSAELRPNQTDQDTLPPYDLLDAILEAYIVQGRSTEEIQVQGLDPDTVRRVVRLIDASEYKRRQAAPGLKVTTRAFGMGRRVPIAQRYRG
jgi:NAD+ synthetase